jgi:hypothetical protein
MMTKLTFATLAFSVSALVGCTSAATEACKDKKPGSPPAGAAAGATTTECNICCQSKGSYQAANNSVEAKCKCN